MVNRTMIKDNIKNFTKGWFIGNFEPSLLKTADFEVSIQHHKKGDTPEKHYQKIATEYNVVVSGSLISNGEMIGPGDIFIFEPMEITDVVFLEDSEIVCVKTPSLGFDDKVIVD